MTTQKTDFAAVRQSFYKARRSIKKIESTNPPLALHLYRQLRGELNSLIDDIQADQSIKN